MKPSTPDSAVSRVVLGVTGGIAAYKAVELTRRLREAGFHVAPILTPDATRFVGALTFSALASEPARVSLYDDATTPIPHTYLGQTADLIVVAPATAHFIARFAMGLADDLLTATLLASRAPVLICPAMHTEMWEQPSVQENLATLRRRGVLVMEPDSGVLAGGDEGAGRLPEPEAIAALVEQLLAKDEVGILSGRRVVVSAGGTREPIDPVRVLSNRSSGRQGHALAEVAARLGATVQLVTTASLPLALDVRNVIEVIRVETAAQMSDAVTSLAQTADAVIMAAAVADFGVIASPVKIKKQDGVPSLVLVPTLDILTSLVEKRRDGQVIVGFGAESDNVIENGLKKIRAKRCDLLVVNDVSKEGAGFDHATNEVFLIGRDEAIETISLRSKEAVSYEILTRVAALLTRGAQ
jgi:phosphopantothenoylcysteine decarboxylase/phosphopantothenate--cysteine ligase